MTVALIAILVLAKASAILVRSARFYAGVFAGRAIAQRLEKKGKSW